MCTIPPAPPPPPPVSNNPVISNKPSKYGAKVLSLFNSDLCEWAVDHIELREVCNKYSICLYKEPYRYKFKYFEAIQQVGPMCGLVALSMLLNGEICADKILSLARDIGYTNNGEMFSCKHLAELATEVFKLANINNLAVQVVKGGLNSQETVDRLLNGAALLVPYDADSNHSPCLNNGHTAHWALICGIIISKDRDFGVDPHNVNVFAKHGKSKYLAAWNLQELEASNKNLYDFSPKKAKDGLVYVLPEDGIGGEHGLRDQFLVFTNS